MPVLYVPVGQGTIAVHALYQLSEQHSIFAWHPGIFSYRVRRHNLSDLFSGLSCLKSPVDTLIGCIAALLAC
jgi:hypothetical protein